MSLINDALKRAKAAQDQNASAQLPELKFRQPVVPVARSKSPVLLLVIIAAGIVCLAAVVAVAVYRLNKPMPVAAAPAREASSATQQGENPSKESRPWDRPESAREAASSPLPFTKPSPVPNPGTGSTIVVSQPDVAVAPKASEMNTSSGVRPENTPDVASHSPNPTPAQADAPLPSPAPEPVAPKTPEPKLQGIFYSPSRPSAMINGRTVFVGDKVGDWRVLAIDQESATLTGNGRTNVLSLAQ